VQGDAKGLGGDLAEGEVRALADLRRADADDDAL
jgi:hypothetical protein